MARVRFTKSISQDPVPHTDLEKGQIIKVITESHLKLSDLVKGMLVENGIRALDPIVLGITHDSRKVLEGLSVRCT